MAYNFNNLSVLAYANNFTLWHYTTPDIASAVIAAGYFSKAADMVRVGDLIITNVDTGGTGATNIYVVTANTGTAVTVALFVA